MSNDLSRSARIWVEGILARLGVPDAQRYDCVSGASIVLGGIKIVFLQPATGDEGYVVARAMVAEVPPKGQCESLYEIALEVQGNLCGPHTPVLGLDWPVRTLMVSCTLEMSRLSADDAAAIVCSTQQMAVQWREAMARMSTASADHAPQAVGQW